MAITPYPHTCPVCGTVFLCYKSRHRFCSPSCRAVGVNDRRRVGRSRGEAHPRAKLTEADVRDIRTRYGVGDISMRNLAAHFQVSYDVIWRIVRRQGWTHVA